MSEDSSSSSTSLSRNTETEDKKMSGKAEQTGPPVRIGAYQLSVTVQPKHLLARAVLVADSNRNLPREIRVSDKDIVYIADNVASDALIQVPHAVTRALLKMTGWNIEYPDSMNPNMKRSEPGQ